MSGRVPSERVVDFNRNKRTDSTGMSGRIRPEYAFSCPDRAKSPSYIDTTSTIRVPRVVALPPASFRFRLATGTLAFGSELVLSRPQRIVTVKPVGELAQHSETPGSGHLDRPTWAKPRATPLLSTSATCGVFGILFDSVYCPNAAAVPSR